MRGIAADTRKCMQVLASIAACILNLWLHGTVCGKHACSLLVPFVCVCVCVHMLYYTATVTAFNLQCI